MTDMRNDAVLERTIRKLPRQSGIIFRHYHLDEPARAVRFAQLKRLARRYHHLILLADSPALARKWGAHGVHGRQWKRRDTKDLLHSAPVHNRREIRMARYNGVDILFLSPAFSTQSHPGKRPLNSLQLRRLAGLCGGYWILLGGMDRQRFVQNKHLGAHGWAAIDGLSNN